MEESNEREMNNERNEEDKEEPNGDKGRENESTQKSECNNCNCELSDPKETERETEREDNPKNEEPTTTTCCEVASDVSETAKTEEQRQQESLCKNRRKCYEKSKECCQTFPKPREPNVSGKAKRKSRSTRRRLNALVSNNSSLHFSDTDSEDELLTTIRQRACNASAAVSGNECPEISVTLEETQSAEESATNPNCLLTASEETVARRSRRGSFAENLTDVDEFYPSEPEADESAKENFRDNGLTVTRATAGETDVEDLSNDEADVPTILVSPKIDLLCEFNGETITTTEGDGPFSVEIRNRIISRMDSLTSDDPGAQNSPDIVIMPTTDSEDIEMSDDDEFHEASCSQRELLEDLEALAASQIVMTNLNKVESASNLNVKDVQDDGSIGDCHTDVEDVD